jgi:hypothetical protein
MILYRTHSSAYWLLMFDTNIDIVSSTLFYLLNCLCPIPISIFIEHTLLPTKLLMFDTNIDIVSSTLFYLLNCLCPIPISILFLPTDCLYWSMQNIPYRTVPYRTVPYRTVPYRTVPYRTVPYRNCIYSRLPQDEPSRSKNVEDIKLKN